MTQILDHEKFETVKELSALGIQVAEAGGLLAKLKGQLEEFYKEREAEAQKRVQAVLDAGKSVLAEAATYFDAFKGYLETTRKIREDVTNMLATLSTLREQYQKAVTDFDTYVSEKTTLFSTWEKEIKEKRIALQKHEEYLNTQHVLINRETIKIADEWAAVRRAIERLKKGKI
jgi:hypothetical protein